MRSFSTLILAAWLGSAAMAQETAAVTEGGDTMTDAAPVYALLDAHDVSLGDFLWTARPVVVFADSPNDPRYAEQIELLTRRWEELVARDVVVIVDTDPENPSDIRLKLRPRGFMLALIGKDGEIELRKPNPWHVRELTRVIDKMPLRQQEIRDGR